MSSNSSPAHAMSFDESSSSSPSRVVWVHPNKLHILNATQSETRSLPSELLSIIFQHACPTPDIFDEEHTQTPKPFHLILRLVSTLWYDVSQSTPQLWSSVFLPKICAENVDIRAQYLKLCLDKSGDLPLTLFLQFGLELWEAGYFISPIVDATLERSTHRIRALRLLRPPRIWLEILILKMYRLATIHFRSPLSPPASRDERLFLPKTAHINRIHLQFPRLLDLRLEGAMSSVTHMDLNECPIDFVMEFLLRCPNLIEFHSRSPFFPSQFQDPRSILKSPLVLSHLSAFTWSTNVMILRDWGWYTVLYEHIHFPSLTRFNWAPGHLWWEDHAALAFLSRFPKSVTTLQFGEVCSDIGEVTFSHFLPLASVTQLRLFHCNYYSVVRAFSILSKGTDESNILFPKLTSLVIHYQVIEGTAPLRVNFGPEIGNKLAHMLRSRIGLIDQFTLIVETAYLTQRWNNEIWQALREVKRDGLDLNIIEHGHPIVI